jgi:chorismate synthase
MIENTDQRPRDYTNIKDSFRPGHADYTYWAKYGIRDYRGGGRSSARETASRVAAGAIARKILAKFVGPAVTIRGALVQIGPHAVDRARWDWNAVEQNPFWCPDPAMVARWSEYLDGVRKAGSSTGAIIEIVAAGIPAGLGEPIYDKLDSDIARALMSINAVKGVEIGAGFAAAALSGEENGDEMRMRDGKVIFLSNQAGGILGGISSGQDIVARFAVKPTSSILTPRRSVTASGEEVEVSTKGRHDPCVGIRAAPIAEAMLALVVMDHVLRHRAQCGDVRVVPAPIAAQAP